MSEQITRRDAIKRVVYIPPAILTLTAVPAFATNGSGSPGSYYDDEKKKEKQDLGSYYHDEKKKEKEDLGNHYKKKKKKEDNNQDD
jgi:hypothetical protein